MLKLTYSKYKDLHVIETILLIPTIFCTTIKITKYSSRESQHASNKSKVAVGRHFDKSSAVAEMGDRLATIDMGRKVGRTVPLSVGELGIPSNAVSRAK